MAYSVEPVFVNLAQQQRLAVAACKLVELVRKMPGGRELIAKKMAQTRAERGDPVLTSDSEACM